MDRGDSQRQRALQRYDGFGGFPCGMDFHWMPVVASLGFGNGSQPPDQVFAHWGAPERPQPPCVVLGIPDGGCVYGLGAGCSMLFCGFQSGFGTVVQRQAMQAEPMQRMLAVGSQTPQTVTVGSSPALALANETVLDLANGHHFDKASSSVISRVPLEL